MNYAVEENYYNKKVKPGKNSDLYNQEIVAIVDKLLEYKGISEKQHNQILIKCNLLNK